MSLENLELDVALKLAIVDKSLTKVEDYRKQLQENARKVKEDIHEAVDRQVVALRGRERQLVRQVEVVTAHQNCLLSTQQAGLMHSQGALTATKNLLQRCTSADISTLSKINMDDIPCTNIQPINLVSVELNEVALTSAIGAFGSVQLPETITHHPSPVIPAKVEEYEDEDHDVLHKSVAGAASGPDSPMRITVQFPRLNQQSWLIDHKQGTSVTGFSSKAQRVGDSKCTVTSWLSNLQLSGTQDEEEAAPTSSSIGSFDLMSNCGSTPALTSESSSIEIVPSHIDSDKEECSTLGSVCEIENLSNCIQDKSCWLRPKQTSSELSSVQQIKIADVCQANEPCSNFSECICKGSCVDSALQKARQSAAYHAKVGRKRTISEVYNSNPVLSHMADILSSDNSKWLVKNPSSLAHMPKRSMYKAPGEMWLSSSTTVSTTSPQAAHVVLSTHSNIWLLHKLKAEKAKEKKEKIEDDDEKKEFSQTASDELAKKLKDFGLHRENVTNKICFKEPVLSTGTPSSASYLRGNSGNNSLFDNKFFDDKMHDLTLDKSPWLACSPAASPNLKLSKTSLSLPFIPDSMLTVAQSNLDSWLLKRL